jgi:hypothetical protein
MKIHTFKTNNMSTVDMEHSSIMVRDNNLMEEEIKVRGWI